MIFSDCVRHDATFPVYGVAVGRMQWPDRYLPAHRGRDQTPGECLLIRRVTLMVREPPDNECRVVSKEVWECRAE